MAKAATPPRKAFHAFFQSETAGGVMLMLSAVVALIFANTTLEWFYFEFKQTPVVVKFGAFEIDKPLLLWINDGLMAVFFFLVGLEIKREFMAGELSRFDRAVLPFIGAAGGMALPALVYVYFTWGDPIAMNGWAIPAATDIAFALGVLSLFSTRVPISVKVLLTAIAIIDDLGAILIIAIFYTSQVSMTSLAVAAVGCAILAFLNLRGVTRISFYMVVGIVMWAAVLKSGVHATLAGVLIALFIPLRVQGPSGEPPLIKLEHGLQPWVKFFVLPIFGYANAGVSFAGMTFASVLEPITLGIVLGLFVGKQIGIFVPVWLAVKMRLSPMPEGANWGQLYAMSAMCGIGFTMSLFIGTLAFEPGTQDAAVRLGVLVGSVMSAIVGYFVMAAFSPAKAAKAQSPAAA